MLPYFSLANFYTIALFLLVLMQCILQVHIYFIQLVFNLMMHISLNIFSVFFFLAVLGLALRILHSLGKFSTT
jgi:hypothetical protein